MCGSSKWHCICPLTSVYHDFQLPSNLHASVVSYCSGAAEVQHSRLPATTGAVRVLESVPTLYAHVIFLPGFKRPSRKCVLCRGCDEIAGSLSVRRKTAPNRTRRDSFELTIRRKALQSHLDTDVHMFPPLDAEARPAAQFHFSRVTYQLPQVYNILFVLDVRSYTPLVIVAIVCCVSQFLTASFLGHVWACQVTVEAFRVERVSTRSYHFRFRHVLSSCSFLHTSF